jgi:hypothetical protein
VPCTFSVAPTSISSPAAGDSGDIGVTASAADCSWTAASSAGWITIQGASGGNGSGRIRIVVAANTDTSPRTGALTVAGSTVTVTQAAAAPPPCSYAVTPNPVDVGFAGDNDIDLHVVTTGGCAWTATSQADWITIARGGSGSGDGHVHIAVAAAVSAGGRVGTVSIGGQTVTVNQAGILNQEVTMTGTISGLSGACPNRSFTISGTTVLTNRDTEYPGKDDCGDLREGESARVRGIGQGDGSIRATRIDHIGGALALPEEE